MKNLFKESTVFKRFEEEEDQEKLNDETQIDQEIKQMESKYNNLESNYKKLEQ
jgi:hypothetical protein